MSDADRIARVALSRLGEPGDPRLSALVAELGAVRVCDYLREERDVTGVATDVAARLAGLDPAGSWSARTGRASGSWCPATTSGTHDSPTSTGAGS